MGFDDLARHMASRDKKKLGSQSATADELVAEMAKADRRMDRTRDLVLGPILLLGGLIIGTLYGLYVLDVLDVLPHPARHQGDFWVRAPGVVVLSVGMMIVGARRLFRGMRSRA
jgi:hypothetical protein